MNVTDELYQQVILEHNKKPRNFRKLEHPTHSAEGYNPLCGDHYHVFLSVDEQGKIDEVTFEGSGCAISKASASMMTQALKGKTTQQANELFEQFHKLVVGELKPNEEEHDLGKLEVFAGVWKYPTRVKCAALSWHTMSGALKKDQEPVSTE